MPMMPLAPGRLSTMTGCPQASVSFCAMARTVMSTPEPAVVGSTMRMGRFGNAAAWSAACAGGARHPSTSTRAAPAGRARENPSIRQFVMVSSSDIQPVRQS